MDVAFIVEVEERAAALDALDYFEVLRLPRTAGAADVKAAYHRESRAFHPDRFAALPEPEVKEQLKRKLEEQFGQTPNGRKLYAQALKEVEAQRWEAAERALKTALM